MSKRALYLQVLLIILFFITLNYSHCQDLKLDWVFHHECEGSSVGQSIVTDDNHLYCAGQFDGILDLGDTLFTSYGNADILLSKYDINGNLVWARQYGGNGYDTPLEICYFNEKIYTIGFFSDTVSFNGIELISYGDNDIFICCHDSYGDMLWVNQLGGTGSDQGYSISTNTGYLYICGIFQDTVDFGVATLTSYGDYDIFLAKLDTLGNIQWVNQGGGSETDLGISITNSQNSIFVCGSFEDTVVFNDTSLVSTGFQDAYIAKYDELGSLLWINTIKSEWGVSANAICSNSNSVFLTGKYGGTAHLNNDSITSNGEFDIYVANYDLDGELKWINSYGSSGMDRSRDVIVDNDVIFNSCYFQYEAEINDTIIPLNTAQLIQLDISGGVKEIIQIGNYSGEQCTIDQYNSIYTTGTFINTAAFGDTTITAATDGANVFISKIDFDNPFYIISYNNSKEVQVYPNPAYSTLTIELPTQPSHNTTLTLSNTNGQQLITQEINELKAEIDLSHLPTGIYIVKVWNDKEVMVNKVIKQ